ncbi:MAG TPA: hypothetical protein DEV81_13190 [Cyanobacteria bacterium UBA11049]|nr:hypothetical protein [Cyanobacteria bacterium UBA11049]
MNDSTVPPPPQAPDGWRSEMLMMQPNGEQLMEITKLIEQGNLKTIVAQVFPFSETAPALELNKTGHTHGLIAIQVIERNL